MSSRTRIIKKGFQVQTQNLVHLPRGYRRDRKYPLVVALHGMGMTAEEFAGVIAPVLSLPAILFIPEGVYPYEIRTGQSIRVGRAWYIYTGDDQAFVRSARASGRHLMTLIDRVEEEYQVNPDKRVLLGFSQGGYFAGYVGVREAAKFRGLVVMGARVKDEVLTRELERVKGLSVLLQHGKKDRSVPFQFAERSRDALEAAGLDIELEPYDTGHHVTPEMVRDTSVWLKKLFGRR